MAGAAKLTTHTLNRIKLIIETVTFIWRFIQKHILNQKTCDKI